MTLTIFFSVVTGICAVTWASFIATEHVVSMQTRESVSQSIMDFDLNNRLDRWTVSVLKAFHGVFGERLFSIKFFLRSFILSSTLLVLTMVVYTVIHPDYTFSIFEKNNFHTLKHPLTVWLGFNVFADYFSLIETVIIISVMGRFRSVSVIFLTLALNIFLTGGIYVLWGALIKFTQELLRVGFAGWVSDLYFFFNMLWSDFTNHLFDYPGHPQQKFRGLGHFAFYTTFFTSVWIWMYALATFVVVLGDRYGGSIWSWLKHFLDFSNRPFSSLGYVACLAVILVSIFAGFIYFSTLWVINLV